jgi:CHAT domain-containing protein
VKVCEAKFHAKAGNWQAADRAWSDAIASSRFSLTSSFTEAGRKREIQIQSEAFFDDASCRLRLGKRKQALLRVEQGKARLLADALSFSVADAKLPGNALAEVTKTTRRIRELEHILRRENISAKVYWDSSAELRESRLRLDKLRHTHGLSESPFASSRNSFRDIQRAVPAGGALVSFLFSSYGSAAFIIKDGQREIRSDNVVVFTERAHNSLKEVRELWTKVQFKEPRRSEKEVLEAVKSGAGGFSIIQPDEFTLLTVSWLLWDVVGPIIERLRHLGVEEGDQILFLPQEGLGLFPLHAAKPLDGPSVVDEFAICYAPSAYVQSVGVQNGVTRQHGEASLLVISDPTRDLRFASAEGELICSKMAGGVFEVLRQGDATRENVTSRCLRKKYLHFSCHGFYNPQEPMKSGLVLSGGIILTAEEILRSMDMSSCRLVVLSACDTGVAESNVLPNEYVGLTAAFLMAGVPAVISSLWQVDDIATMFLMGCFYENIFSALLTPVEALRRATTWLRNVKFRMLRDLCESEAKRLEKLRNPQSALFEELSKSYLNKPDQENKPFDDEYYWALFVINGS